LYLFSDLLTLYSETESCNVHWSIYHLSSVISASKNVFKLRLPDHALLDKTLLSNI